MKKLLAALLALLMMVPLAQAETGVRWIDGGNADRVHLRAAPSTKADSLGLYFTGTGAILIDRAGDWAWVMIGSAEGWMMADYLSGSYVAPQGPWHVVDNPHSTWVNLRMSPSMDGLVAMCPDNGTAVRLLGETADGWSYVDCDGVMGYMRTDLLSAMNVAAAREPATMLSDATSDGYIYQYIAPNGKPIYFTAETEAPYITFEDVNFDGRDDIVILTISGASNGWFKFFVYDKARDEYVYARHTGDDAGIVNYVAYPEYGIIASHGNNGNAGLLHVTNLYRWEGNELRLIRTATSDEWSESSFEGDVYTQVIRGDLLHITVRDYTHGYEGTVIFDQVIPKEAAETRDIFSEEQEALWRGIK